MGKVIDLTGQTFGRLTVIAFHSVDRNRQSVWACVCECGTEVLKCGHSLSRGHVKSCGCLRTEQRKRSCSKAKLYELYEIQGLSAGLIAEMYRVNESTVLCWMKKDGIARRDLSTAQRMAVKTGRRDMSRLSRLGTEKQRETGYQPLQLARKKLRLRTRSQRRAQVRNAVRSSAEKRSKRITLICSLCNHEFDRIPSQVKKARKHFCCRSHYDRYRELFGVPGGERSALSHKPRPTDDRPGWLKEAMEAAKGAP